MCGVSTQRADVGEPPQIGDAAISARRERPIEQLAHHEIVGSAERLLEDFRPCGGCAELGDAALQKRRAERDVLGPGDRSIARAQILDALPNVHRPINQREFALDAKSGQWQRGRGGHGVAGDVEFVPHDGRFAMGRQSGGGFGHRRAAENVDTQIVPHDSREKFRIGAVAVLRVPRMHVGGRFDRRPRWRPQRIDAGALIENLPDVAAFFEHCQPELVVLDNRGAASAEFVRGRHRPSLCPCAPS